MRTSSAVLRRTLASAAVVLACLAPGVGRAESPSSASAAPNASGPAAPPTTPAPAASSAPAANAPANAVPIPKVPVGFSKLIVRLDGTDDIGIAKLDYHVRLIERMRTRGFEAVGAENLVFDKDESRRARFLVGGTVRELACRTAGALSCRIGIEWQVLDVERDVVVYRVTGRVAVANRSLDDRDVMAGYLLDRAMDALLDRPGLRQALAKGANDAEIEAPASFPPATLARCPAGGRVADNADDLLRKVVVIKGEDRFGSGVFVSNDGLLLTAAHVVKDSGRLRIRVRDGTEIEAVPVRVARREDVALLRTWKPLKGQPCAPIRFDVGSGAEVYAAGAPASLDLAFSLTRGIVSGFPILDGHRRLQTDTPVSPGNSGGPLVDASGAVVGIVSFKLVESHVEGVAFAVPAPEALAALGLRLGDTTDATLLTATATTPTDAPVEKAAVEDAPDPIPSLDPQGDRLRAEAAAAEKQRLAEVAAQKAADEEYSRRIPKYAPAMIWGGIVAGAVGAITVAVSYASYQSDPTRPSATTASEFNSLRVYNTIGWSLTALGATSFVWGLAKLPERPKPQPVARTWLRVGPASLGWEGTF